MLIGSEKQKILTFKVVAEAQMLNEKLVAQLNWYAQTGELLPTGSQAFTEETIGEITTESVEPYNHAEEVDMEESPYFHADSENSWQLEEVTNSNESATIFLALLTWLSMFSQEYTER